MLPYPRRTALWAGKCVLHLIITQVSGLILQIVLRLTSHIPLTKDMDSLPFETSAVDILTVGRSCFCVSVTGFHWSQDDADSEKTLELGKHSEATHPSETCLMSYVVCFLICSLYVSRVGKPTTSEKQTARNFFSVLKKTWRKKALKENQDKDQSKSGQETQYIQVWAS